MTDDLLQMMHQKLDQIRDTSLDMALRLERAEHILATITVNLRHALLRPPSEDRSFLEALHDLDFAHFLKTGSWSDKVADNGNG